MTVLHDTKRKHGSRSRMTAARRTPDAGKQAVRHLVTLCRQVLDDHGSAIPRTELWLAAEVTQSAANLVLSGKGTNRIVIARIAEVLCRSRRSARPFVASTKTRLEIRQALTRALPVLEQDAAENVRLELAGVRQRMHQLGQTPE